jgi:type IV pilus assembly protein PilB
MAMNSTIRKLIMQEASTDDLRDAAIADGMLTLRMDGIKKLERGVTTLEEVMKETAAGS